MKGFSSAFGNGLRDLNSDFLDWKDPLAVPLLGSHVPGAGDIDPEPPIQL